MPAKAIDQTNLPYIELQRKCPDPDCHFHLEVWQAFCLLQKGGLDPVTVALSCGCKWKWKNIPSQRRNATRERSTEDRWLDAWHRNRKNRVSGKSTSPRDTMSAAEKRKRFDEARLPLLLPTTRRRR